MKVYLFANDVDSIKKASSIVKIDRHYTLAAMPTSASEQVVLSSDDGAYINAYAKAISEDIKNDEALFITSASDKALAALVAGYLDTAIISDVTSVELNDSVKTCNIVYGGAAVRTCKLDQKINVISISSNYAAGNDDVSLADVSAREVKVSAQKVKVLEINAKASNDVDLNKAKIIVAVGRGFAQKEDLELAYKLADKLGAQIACSRPIAETEKWIDKSRYIGISANIIAPDLYIAIGISGQVQHLVGCVNSKKIVVINKDDKAPFFDSADLGIVGDLKEILKEL